MPLLAPSNGYTVPACTFQAKLTGLLALSLFFALKRHTITGAGSVR